MSGDEAVFEELKVRPATNADAGAVADLVFSVLHEYGLAPDPDNTDADLRDVEGNYVARGGAFDVLEADDGRIVGSVGLYPIDATTCELRKMYLRPAERGRGLGKRLLEYALATARRLGYGRVTLETASVLTEAVSLYQSYGFRPYRAGHLAQRCDQAYCLDL